METQKLIELANELLKEENLDNRSGDLNYLKKQYNILLNRDDDSFYEREQIDKFNALFLELAKKEPRLLRSSFEEKKSILEKARKLLEREDILRANKELDQLFEDFKRAGRCSKEQDDELYAEFRQIKDEFYAKKRAYFEELDKSNAEKREKKENIIARANELLELDNIKEASDKMNALMKEWKEVGYSGKGDEALWREFAKVLDAFQEKRKEHRSEMIKTFEERAMKKEEMIKNAKKLLANSEFTDEEIEKVKGLRKEFNAIGFAGKEKDDELYNQFNAVIQKYFEEMKFYK